MSNNLEPYTYTYTAAEANEIFTTLKEELDNSE